MVCWAAPSVPANVLLPGCAKEPFNTRNTEEGPGVSSAVGAEGFKQVAESLFALKEGEEGQSLYLALWGEA